MRLVSQGLVVLTIAALTACATQAPKTSSSLDDLSDIPRAQAPGALTDPTNDNLNAVLWSQSAAEYDALALQAFNQAARTLAAAKADPTFNALDAAEQSPLPADAPLAIITDIDETVLDSSAFNADLIRNPIDVRLPPAEAHKAFDDRWNAWVAQREAQPVSGALAFLTQADKDGIAIFYVTNRKDPEKAETCNNLIQVKLPLRDCAKNVLTRNEEDGRGKQKGSRRKAIGATHRVVLVLGDNLGDFADGIYASLEARDKITTDHASWWGERWIMLPNPMYGSWEEVLGSDANDAASPTYSVELERRRLRKAQGLYGVDWWKNPEPMGNKAK
jgi:5'-nucleotidase (lipoprotein e(P4) family)